MMFTPNTGRVDINMGNRAQWMAHNTEVVIPTASQFILIFIRTTKIIKCNNVAKSQLPGKLLNERVVNLLQRNGHE